MNDEVTLEEIRNYSLVGQFLFIEHDDDAASKAIVFSIRHPGALVAMSNGSLLDAGRLMQQGWRVRRLPIGVETVYFSTMQEAQTA